MCNPPNDGDLMRRSVLIAGAATVAALCASTAVATARAGAGPGHQAEAASNVLSGSARLELCQACSGGTLAVRLNLQAGENTLAFGNPNGWAPDVDRLSVGGSAAAAPTEPVPEPPPATPPITTPTTVFTTQPPTTPTADPATFAAQEAEVARLVNVERAEVNCEPLTVDGRLTTAARLHSQDMAENNYFSHTSQDGTQFGDRITRTGYRWSRAGENIARGQSTPAEVMSRWMNSAGHQANILNCEFEDIGVGVAADSRDLLIWTQDFGSQR